MTGYVYPRLNNGDARVLTAELLGASGDGLGAVMEFVGFSHGRAAPVPTGGHQASERDIELVRASVMAEVGEWVNGTVLKRNLQPVFDARLGKALHSALDILPADAAHPETWNFLTLVVFPDVALTRFPSLPDERALGTPRNALRRTWIRWEILGDLLLVGDPILGEDELVGILERTSLARNRDLARALTCAVARYDGARSRSEVARDLYKKVRYRTGPLMLDLYSAERLQVLVDDELVSVS